ncbi:MAG: hypothetical protein ABUT20_22345 [Bacteroidota bacterium]
MKEYLQLTEEQRKELYENFLREPDSFYEKAEMDQLREALQKSYTERFLTMTRLMKMGIMFSKAKITRSPLPSTNTK